MSARAGLERAARAKGVAASIWALGLLVSLPAGLLAGRIAGGFFGPRQVAEAAAAGLQPLYMMDLLASRRGELQLFLPLAIGLGILWVVLSPLAHGLAHAGAHRGRAGALALAGRHYLRLLALAPLTWLLLGLVLAPLGAGVAHLGGDGMDGWRSERAVLFGRLSLGLVVLVVFGVLRGAIAHMRARVVIAEAPVFSAFVAGVKGALRAPHRRLWWSAAFLGGAGLLTLGASLVDTRLPRTGPALIALGVGLQQLTAFARAFARVGLAGAAGAHVEAEEAARP